MTKNNNLMTVCRYQYDLNKFTRLMNDGKIPNNLSRIYVTYIT